MLYHSSVYGSGLGIGLAFKLWELSEQTVHTQTHTGSACAGVGPARSIATTASSTESTVRWNAMAVALAVALPVCGLCAYAALSVARNVTQSSTTH